MSDEWNEQTPEERRRDLVKWAREEVARQRKLLQAEFDSDMADRLIQESGCVPPDDSELSG